MSLGSNVELYEKARADRIQAEKWFGLLRKRDHLGEPFKASPAHSKMSIMIAGQERQGDNNYHDGSAKSPAMTALLTIVCGHLEKLGAEAVALLTDWEHAAGDRARNELIAALGEIPVDDVVEKTPGQEG